MPSVSFGVIAATVVILLLLGSPGAASLDFNETILNLEEGSTLNHSTGVELSESLQSIYICITKNSSASYEDFDLNTSLSSGDCITCDNRQNCTHQFNNSINVTVMINQLQNDSIRWITFFKETIILHDDGTKIICAYEASNTTALCSWIYLHVHFLPKPENPINIHIVVLVATLSFALFIIICILLITVIICIMLYKVRSRGELITNAMAVPSSCI